MAYFYCETFADGNAAGVYFPVTGGSGTSIIALANEVPLGDVALILISHDKQSVLQAQADIVAGTFQNGQDVMIMRSPTSFSIRTPSKNLYFAPHPLNDTMVNVSVMVQ